MEFPNTVHVLLDICREMFPSPGSDNLRCGLWFPNFTLPLYPHVTDYDYTWIQNLWDNSK